MVTPPAQKMGVSEQPRPWLAEGSPAPWGWVPHCQPRGLLSFTDRVPLRMSRVYVSGTPVRHIGSTWVSHGRLSDEPSGLSVMLGVGFYLVSVFPTEPEVPSNRHLYFVPRVWRVAGVQETTMG